MCSSVMHSHTHNTYAHILIIKQLCKVIALIRKASGSASGTPAIGGTKDHLHFF